MRNHFYIRIGTRHFTKKESTCVPRIQFARVFAASPDRGKLRTLTFPPRREPFSYLLPKRAFDYMPTARWTPPHPSTHALHRQLTPTFRPTSRSRTNSTTLHRIGTTSMNNIIQYTVLFHVQSRILEKMHTLQLKTHTQHTRTLPATNTFGRDCGFCLRIIMRHTKPALRASFCETADFPD